MTYTYTLADVLVVDGYEAIKKLEGLSKQELNLLLSQVSDYKSSTTEINTQEFVDLIGTEYDGYPANFLLDSSIDSLTDDLDMCIEALSPEMKTLFNRLEQRLTEVLTVAT